MRVLATLHRWLGVALCLLFAMWFASGLVMHFVPFPALTESERLDGMAPIDLSRVLRGPGEVLQASGAKDANRVRLLQRSDGPIYLVSAAPGVTAFHADNLARAAVTTDELASAIALDHGRRRGLEASQAKVAALAMVDQWTVSGNLDPDRPLFRVSLKDTSDTELYVSSTTGLVMSDTTRRERWLNYFGSVMHWIYPTVLRSRPSIWNATVWSLSLVALLATLAGGILGVFRATVIRGRISSPYQGWQKWHHLLGLACMIFVLTWIFSGWLSMDSGWLFSSGRLTAEESTKIAIAPAWDSLPKDAWRPALGAAKEIEWFVFDGKVYRRERTGLDAQRLFLEDSGTGAMAIERGFLRPNDVGAFVARLAPACHAPAVVGADDNYAISSPMPHAPVYRVVCGDIWYQIDGANGAILERLDPSRRAYRWLFGALHTLDIPVLIAHPSVRSAVIVLLCLLGLLFSTTAVVVAWRRLGLQFKASWSARSKS
jgi:hypothetical protein